MTEFLKLLTAEDAWEIFRASFAPAVRVETLRVADALDHVLAQDAVAPHDLPTFVRSTVDGYAVAAADTHGASQGMPAYLDVVAESHMGTRTDFVLGPGQAALVHTGGMVPEGADAVVMIENTHRAGGPMFGGVARQPAFEPYAIEVYRPTAGGDGCIQPGEDVRAGDLVLPQGTNSDRRTSAACWRSASRRYRLRNSPGWASSARGMRWCRRNRSRGRARCVTSTATPWPATCAAPGASRSPIPSRPTPRRRSTRRCGGHSTTRMWSWSLRAARSATAT